MNARIRNYVWHGQFTTEIVGMRAWLDADLAALPRSKGGLAIPDLRAELYALAAVTVSRWAVMGTAHMHIVGDILFHTKEGGLAPAVYITPDFRPAPSNGIQRRKTLWSMGKAMLAQAGLADPDDSSTLRVYTTAAYSSRGYCVEWTGPQLHFDCTSMLQSLAGTQCYKDLQARGTVRLEWLPYAGIGALQVYARDGTRKTLAAASGMNSKTNCMLRDIVSWNRQDNGCVTFQFMDQNMGVAQRTMAEELAIVLVANYTEIATRPLHPMEVSFTATPVDHPVIVNLRTTDAVELMIHDTVMGPPTSRVVTHHGDITATLKKFMAPDVEVSHVHPHPALSRLVCLWVGHRRWSRRRGDYKCRVMAATSRKGAASRSERATKWKEHSDTAAQGLGQLEWSRIRRVIGLNPWGEQVLLRLKLHAFSMFDVQHSKMGCPHKQCVHRHDVSIHHVFWECPAAMTLRRHFLQAWRRLGLRDTGLEHAIFSLHLNELPSGIWKLVDEMRKASSDPHLQLAEAVTAVMEGCWRIGVAICLQSTWRWRVNYFDDLNNITEGHHTAMLQMKLRHGYRTVHLHMKKNFSAGIGDLAAEIVQRALYDGPACGNLHLSVHYRRRYVLFFGGRTRGKTGQAGSGAVLLRTSTTGVEAEICWLAHMSYASGHTTAHMADNLGLYVGLTECMRRGQEPIHVVGDTIQVIEQHRRRKTPTALHLKPIHWRCRRMTTRMMIQGWHHQSRDTNLMVNQLANMAIDGGSSRQVRLEGDTTVRHHWEHVTRYMEADLAPWIVNMENTAQEDAVAASQSGRRQEMGRRKPGPGRRSS